MISSTALSRADGRGREAASASLATAVVLACSACYQFAEVELPPVRPQPVPPVEISRIVPEGCTRLGEVSATGSARDDPSQATERARNQLRRNAAALGGNYVVLEMETGGPTHVESSTTGGPTWGGAFKSHSEATAELEVALWGTAFSCPITVSQPAENAPCGVHDDCPAGQFCAPSGVCRRP
jgi:hypothetical protein